MCLNEYEVWLLNTMIDVIRIYCWKFKYFTCYLLQSSFLGHLHNTAWVPAIPGSMSESWESPFNKPVILWMSSVGCKYVPFSECFNLGAEKSFMVSKGNDWVQKPKVWLVTAELIVHCAMKCCHSAETNHSPTTPVSFFKFWL